jgi:glucokinase
LNERWLLIDVANRGEVRMAAALPGQRTLGDIHRFDTEALPTFTDALLLYERRSGQRLHGVNAIIAVAGAAVGDSIPIARTRWNISRSGLSLMLGRPVTILNEVAAQAWATVSAMPLARPIRGIGGPDLQQRGRYLFVTLGDGLGTAIIDIDDHGNATVLDSEGGHTDFVPRTERGQALCRALSPHGVPVTYEQVLTLPAADGIWRTHGLGVEADREAFRARAFGRWAANQVFSTGAWQGVLACGRLLPSFDGAIRAAFENGFTERASFRRLIANARCWRIEQREPVLAGAAALMAQRHRLLAA